MSGEEVDLDLLPPPPQSSVAEGEVTNVSPVPPACQVLSLLLCSL